MCPEAPSACELRKTPALHWLVSCTGAGELSRAEPILDQLAACLGAGRVWRVRWRTRRTSRSSSQYAAGTSPCRGPLSAAGALGRANVRPVTLWQVAAALNQGWGTA